MKWIQIRDILIRYGLATIGLFLVAIGVAVSIISNLGTSPLSCPSYVMNGVWGLTVGNWTIIINCLYIFVQLAVLRSKFKLKYLMQIPASLVFGYLIDFSLWLFAWIVPGGFVSRVVLIVIACLVTALGISVEVIARGWMLSAEMTVYAFTKVTRHLSFGTIKVIMDSVLVVISIILAYLMYRNPFGFGEYTGILDVIMGNTEGVVIGLGTLIMALLTGTLMKITDPVANKCMDWIIKKYVYGGNLPD